MATLATKYDSAIVEHFAIRWNEDLTGAQRGAIASEVERQRFIPEYQWVKLGELYIDESYQRPISEPRVWQIATTFTWSLMQALWVGNRGGKLYIVDGRHRFAAACILGSKILPQVPCEIRRTQSVEEEARIFVELTEKRRDISSAQRFAAKLLYKDPSAMDLAKIIKAYGYKVRFDEISRMEAAQGEISAIATLEKIYRAGGRARVSGVLQIIRDAWDAVPPTTSSWMLRAVSRLLELEPNKSPTTLARRLKDKDPWGLIERGQRFGHSNEIPQVEAIADVLLKVTE